MKKKHIALLLTILIFGVSGCANKESVETISTIDEVVEVESSEIIESTEIESSDIEESTEIESSEVIESTEITSEVEITTEETTTVEETTEIEETETPTVAEMSTKSTEEETIEFEEYTAYTNTSCNIRSLPSKTGNLLGTYPINTEVIVVNEIDGWSQLEYDGCIAFIKSTLLSDTMTQVSKPSGNTTQSVPQQQAPQTQNSGLSPELQDLLEKEKAERGTVQYSDTYGQTSGISEADKQAIADLSENVVVY